MSIFKKTNSPYWHFDFQFKGRRVYGSTGCTSKRDAIAFEARERRKLILPDLTRPPITIDEAAGLYQERAEDLPSWPTIRYMTEALVHGLGKSKLLSEISQRDLQLHFAKRRKDRADSSINREIENARAIWRHAERTRFDVGELPDWAALRYRVPDQVPRELSPAEEAKLFEALREDLKGVADFALKSGWRRSEIMGLRWSDVDLGARQAVTRIKGGAVIRRPLTATLVAIIANQPKVGPFVFSYVCQQSRDKRRKGVRYPMTATAFRKGWAAALAACGIDDFRFHDLRHTTGTRIVRATGNLAAAKAALAHTNIKTTLRYAHVLDDDVRAALDASLSNTDRAPADVTALKAEGN